MLFMFYTSSCMTIDMRKNARYHPPPNPYPGIRTLFAQNSGGGGGGFRLNPNTLFEYCLVGIIIGTVAVVVITDIILEITIDTVLLPTDLLFSPGAIIAEEPYGSRLQDVLKNTTYNAYKKMLKTWVCGIIFTVDNI